ncbi:hypothetical protein [Novosphingobium sp. Fuku2-ISO-50]|uniref:hypothetical protein n=1 Tax=Novosphingobium sp. Fuku2-ISO-50 TaxID=1739114 RepID=UPI000A553FFE|nr:hypothetical protein [Novosphingobium sp. Fuku2-ISO-50]
MDILKRGRRIAIGMIASASLATSAHAGELVQCSHADVADISISLGIRTGFGAALGCIKAPFAVDMTPCAPANGFGMSAGTGTAPLVGITHQWQGYMNHMGPVMGFRMDESSYDFSGMFVGFGKLTRQWDFHLSRITGKGVATVPGKAPVTYDCTSVRQRL